MTRRFTSIACLLLASCFAFSADAHESSARHWQIASPDPDRIVQSFVADPTTSRAVSWRTDTSVKEAYAEFAQAQPGPEFFKSPERINARTELLSELDDRSPRADAAHYHSVELTGLKPDTLYAYRVGDGDKRWSEWIQFRTASDQPKKFSFLYFGDAQNEVHSKWSRVIRMAHRTAPDAAFSIHAGDLVNEGHADREWAEWMSAGGFLHAERANILVTGNHEYRPIVRDKAKQPRQLSLQWRPQFALPIEEELDASLHETVYTVVYQGVQIIVLNSNTLVKEQAAYLEKKLKEGDYRWRVVTFHHPVFAPSRGPKDGDKAGTRAHWKPVLEQYGADLVLQGHDHTYARGHTPRRTVGGELGTGTGTMYVTSVSGPKMYKINQDGMKAYGKEDGLVNAKTAKDTQFFQVITVDGDRLVYRAYTATGELYDATAIQKDAQGNKSLVQADGNE